MFLRIRGAEINGTQQPDTFATLHQAFIRDFYCCMDQLAVTDLNGAFMNWYPRRLVRHVWMKWKYRREPWAEEIDWLADYL